MNPNGNMLRWRLGAGALAALAWTLADGLLVGFVPGPLPAELKPLLEQLHGDADLFTLMLDGGPTRLGWGVLLATFSLPLYLLASRALAQLVLPRYGRWLAPALALSYCWLPLAHAGFYYLGRLAQIVRVSSGPGLGAALAAYNDAHDLLFYHWLASLGLAYGVWLGLLYHTLAGHSLLPRWAALLNPLPLTALLAGGAALFPASPLAAGVGGASINLAALIFYAGSRALIPPVGRKKLNFRLGVSR